MHQEPRIRALVVDDAVVIRKIVTDVLSACSAVEVAGTAPNGRIALGKIPQVNPDIVVLDVEMADMDGLETLRAIRKNYPSLPVIMFSTLTERGAYTTIEALSLGASDYVHKPSNVGSLEEAKKQVSENLLPKLLALCGRHGAAAPAATPVPAAVPRQTPKFMPTLVPGTEGRVDIVAIGVSTGGPNALAEVFKDIPELPVPVVITQHMPPSFTKLLAERLNSTSKLKVHEGAQGQEIEPGHVYIAPGDYHMELVREGVAVRIKLHQSPPENSCRPAVDVMFRSVANVYGAHTLAVILTGMGKDGLRGCETVRAAQGQILAQDKATSVVWGMPGFVAEAGLADAVLPLKTVAPEILRRVARRREGAR